ncbi:MAG: hypothetical protein AAB368_11200 [bacterium]
MLGARLWGGAAPGTLVFSRAAIVPSGVEPWGFVGELRTPYTLISFAGATADPEHPEYLPEVNFDITFVVDVSNDQFGEGSIVGAGVASANNSAGKGLLDVLDEVHAVVRQIDSTTDGFRLRAKTISDAGAIAHQGRTLAAMTVRVTGIGTMTETA